MIEERFELDTHPVREVVAQLLKDGTGEKALFDKEAQARLTAVVDDFVAQDDHELQPVVRTLIAIFEWLRDEERSPRAAEALKSTFKRPKVIARVEAIEAEIRARARKTRRAAAAEDAPVAEGWGGRRGRRAPTAGARVPVGPLKLGNLPFPKKL